LLLDDLILSLSLREGITAWVIIIAGGRGSEEEVGHVEELLIA
jgi:hypothetical protein